MMSFFQPLNLILVFLCPVGFLISEEQPAKSSSVKEELAQPSATLSGRTVTLQPFEATFEIPQSWLSHYRTDEDNLHLTRREIDKIKDGIGEWDSEYGKVVNAVFSIDDCAMHGGNEGWGKDGHSYFDVQMRAYVLAADADDIPTKMINDGVEAAHQLNSLKSKQNLVPKLKSKKSISLKQSEYQQWKRSTLEFELFFDDYGGTAHVDVFSRDFDKQKVALVFMYVKSPFKEFEDVPKIVDSFRRKE